MSWPSVLRGTRGLALLGVVMAVAACSSVSGRTPERDRSMEILGSEREEPGATTRTPEVKAPTPWRPGRSDRGQRVADIAMKYRGAPYRWGGAGPSGFDCSGLVQYVYAQIGVWLPRSAAMQYRYGTPISRDSLEPGDLVFFDRLRHAGIYIGQGRFIHSRQTGRRVGVATLDEDWYRSRWVGARRP